MMGTANTQTAIFQYTSVEQLVPADDPLRAIEAVIDWQVIRDRLVPHYSETGRPPRPSVDHPPGGAFIARMRGGLGAR